MPSIASLRRAAGSLLVVGLGGTELTGLERAWLRVVRPAGIILFKRNITDVDQTRALLNEATGLGALHSIRCVDVEGGTVNRFRDALGPMPSAQAVARAERTLPERKRGTLAREHGDLIARSVRAFGCNTTLAPVVDLGLPASAQVLGTRPAAADPAEVVAFAREFLEGLAAQQVAGCGKHFPGLGSADLDSHFVTPEIARTFSETWDNDLIPYRELHRLMPIVMTSHAAYPRTPGKTAPASASQFWIANVLRKRIGYRGLVFTDDLEMGGILKFMTIEEAVVTATRAGTDLLEICHSAELILRAFEALLAEAEASAAFRKLLLARSAEVQHKRARLFSGIPPRLTPKRFEQLRTRVARFMDRVTALSAGDSVAPRTVSPAEHA